MLCFQDQLREVQDFLHQVDKYRPHMEHVSSLADSADPTGEGAPSAQNQALQERYQHLQALASKRQDLLAEFLPSVQQYESSRGAWRTCCVGGRQGRGSYRPLLPHPLPFRLSSRTSRCTVVVVSVLVVLVDLVFVVVTSCCHVVFVVCLLLLLLCC